jgi:hypothetical protein
LEAIRDRGDAAWTTGAGGTNPLLLQTTTIATLATQTSFTLTAGSDDDDAYNGLYIIITDQTTSTQKAVGEISDYTGSTKTITLGSDPGIFTMAAGDTVDIVSVPVMRGTDGANTTTPPTAAAIRTEMDSNSTQLSAIVSDTNELQGDWADGGRLDLILDARASQASVDVIDGIVDDILVDTGTTLDTKLDDIQGSGFSTSTDSLEAIRDRGDSAWTTGAGGTPPDLLQNTTIATLASQTSFTLTAGSADDDAYNDMLIVVTDQTTSTQKAVGTISDYTGSTRTVTLSADPGVFTMAVGDTVDIIAVGSTSSAPTVTQIRQEMDSNSTQLAAIVADTNELQGDWTNGGRLDLIIDDILADTNELQADWANGGRLDLLVDQIISDIAALNDVSTADVNAQMLDVLATDVFSELSSVPSASTTIVNMLRWMFLLARNELVQTSGQQTIRNDGDTSDVGTATLSDVSGTATRGKWQ